MEEKIKKCRSFGNYVLKNSVGLVIGLRNWLKDR